MHPLKTIKDLVPSFAMEMGRPVEEVTAVMSYYYKRIRATASQLDCVNIHLENLGNFYIKERALDATIEKYERFIVMLSDNKINEYASKLSAADKLALMQKTKAILDNERSRRKLVIDKRFNNESTKNLES